MKKNDIIFENYLNTIVSAQRFGSARFRKSVETWV